ncbi:MAG: rhamnogalacturonan lyase family protein [Candidatus Zipacnadales bacterium]
MRMSWVIVFVLLEVALADKQAIAQPPDLAIPNADFEQANGNQPADWRWWSRDGSGSATIVPGKGRDGSQAAYLMFEGGRDWAFSNSKRFPVKPGEKYTVRAWARGDLAEGIEIAIVALGGGKTLSWSIGGDSNVVAPEWSELRGGAVIPEGCDQVYVRFVGSGQTHVYVDDVSLEMGLPPRPPKSKVHGWAKTRVTEKLDRGMVAVPVGNNAIHVSWRLLADDPKDLAFDLYRTAGNEPFTKRNLTPLVTTTDFLDEGLLEGTEYTYELRKAGASLHSKPLAVARVRPSAQSRPYISIKLDGDHTFQKLGLGDLDGDGRYDYVLKQPNSNIDPYEAYWKPSPGTYKLEAYDADGKFLWRYDLGWAIEQGIWYSPMVVYDLDGDGKAEVAVKTGEGDPRDADGRVQSGPEYLTVLNGETGREITRTDWPSRERIPGYNYQSRNQLCVAYLDGQTPCLITERGTYNVMKAVAYSFRNGKLTELWRWEEKEEMAGYRGQGAHITVAADVDEDGRDEVILGSSVLDDNGVGLWSTGLGHPDHMYVGEIDPERPGLEIYYGIETAKPNGNGMCLVEAKTGQIIWGLQEPTKHIHSSGMCADIDASHVGLECYGGERDLQEQRWLFSARGELIQKTDLGGLAPRPVYWDADPQREIIRGKSIVDYGGGEHTIVIEGAVIMVVDLLGDWREEIVTTLPGEMRIYTTPIPAVDRRTCLLQDPVYRNYVVAAGMGYYQVPMQGVYFGGAPQ